MERLTIRLWLTAVELVSMATVVAFTSTVWR